MVPRVGVCKAEGKVHSVMSLINMAHPSCWIRGCHYFLPLDVCECVGLLHSAPLMFSESPEGKSSFQKLLMVSVVAVCYCQVWSFCWSQFDAVWTSQAFKLTKHPRSKTQACSRSSGSGEDRLLPPHLTRRVTQSVSAPEFRLVCQRVCLCVWGSFVLCVQLSLLWGVWADGWVKTTAKKQI